MGALTLRAPRAYPVCSWDSPAVAFNTVEIFTILLIAAP